MVYSIIKRRGDSRLTLILPHQRHIGKLEGRVCENTFYLIALPEEGRL